jgi:molybdopterin/thiamine biosynthesis adenylyltransferase
MTIQLRSHLLIPNNMRDKRALIVGAGTVGSNVAMALAAIGVRHFTIVDHDSVDIHNLPSQAFSYKQVGSPKSVSLADNMIDRFGLDGLMVEAIPDKFTPSFPGNGDYEIIISGADSMTVRKMVSMWARGSKARLVDSRCAGHEIQTWAYDTTDHDQYETYRSTLYADSESSSLPCGGEMYPIAGLAAAMNTLAAVSTTGFFYRVADTERSAISG